MNKKTAQRIIFCIILAMIARQPLMNLLPLGPKPLNHAVSRVKQYAKESETFGVLGFSKGTPYRATDWVNQFLAQEIQLSGHSQEVVFLDRSLESDQNKKAIYANTPYQLTLSPDDKAHAVSISGYKNWMMYPLFTKFIKLSGTAALTEPVSVPEIQAPYDLDSGIIIFDVNTETTGPDSLNLGLEKKMIFRKGGLEEIQEHKGGMDWKGMRSLHFRTVTRGGEQFTTRFYEGTMHRRYRSKHPRLLRFNETTLRASGAVSMGTKEIQGKTCQAWSIPSTGIFYCTWKGIPLEIREKIDGHLVIHMAVGIQENSEGLDPAIFNFKAAKKIGTPDFDLSGGSVTKLIMEQLLSEINQ